jgi:6-pyruvoyltetrahydropterin/6-carboxytetrahydropterin synthase
MFELTVEREFCAAHAIAIDGQREPVHGHNWKVKVMVAGPSLDRNQLLCDFHLIERHLAEVVDRLNTTDLNITPPFDRLNPTAERVAQHIGEELAQRLPANLRLVRSSVSEAPGCTASYLPD